MKSLSSVVEVGVLGEVTRLKSADILLRVLCSGVLNKLGRLLNGLSVVGLVKGLSLLVDFLAVTATVWALGVVVSSSVVEVEVEMVDGVVAELRLMVLSLLTPSMLDKVTSINLSTENPPDTSVELVVVVVAVVVGSVLDLEILSVQSADCQLSISHLESGSVSVSVSVATLTASSSCSSSSSLPADVTPAKTSCW